MIKNPRIRGIAFGAIGGLVGWAIAEAIFGVPTNLAATLGFGGLSGAGIATFLGIGQGAGTGSSRILGKAAVIGMVVGIIGGAIGSYIGTSGYQMALGNNESSNASSADGKPQTDLSMFSSKIRKRLEEGNAKLGSVQISLAWENRNDLDLHVLDPDGFEICFAQKVAPVSKGELDIDRNVNFIGSTNEPVEHVVWEDESAPYGNYKVYVNHYTKHHLQPDKTEYEVEVLVDGELEKFTGLVDSVREPMVLVHEFDRNRPESVIVKEASSFWTALIARVLGWLIFGALVGSAQGATRGSARGLRNATLGGAIGGMLGGLAFEAIAQVLVPVGIGDLPSRVLGFTILGVCIGLFVVLVEQALSAVLKVRNGKFEGRELLVDRLVFAIGTDDSLPGFIGGDDQVKPHHADIETEMRAHFLVARDGEAFVNDQKVKRQKLNNGDQVRIGKTRFVYRFRGTTPSGTKTAVNGNPTPTAPPPPPPMKTKQRDSVGRTFKTTSSQSLATNKKDSISTPTAPPPPPMKSKQTDSVGRTSKTTSSQSLATNKKDSIPTIKAPPPPPGKKK
jgi:pSer/pThr/pTyr-binding forkhead associated (FHA) protein